MTDLEDLREASLPYALQNLEIFEADILFHVLADNQA